MIRGVSYSRRAVSWLAAGVALAGLGALGRSVLRHSWRQAERQRHGQAAELSLEIAGKRDFGTAQLESWHQQVRRARESAAAPEVWAQLDKRLGARWRRNGAPDVPKGSAAASFRRGSFTFREPVADDWPEVLASVEAVEALPGLAIESIEMIAAPEGASRGFELVRMSVVSRLRPSTSNPLSDE